MPVCRDAEDGQVQISKCLSQECAFLPPADCPAHSAGVAAVWGGPRTGQEGPALWLDISRSFWTEKQVWLGSPSRGLVVGRFAPAESLQVEAGSPLGGICLLWVSCTEDGL